jgi:hypothetical protein
MLIHDALNLIPPNGIAPHPVPLPSACLVRRRRGEGEGSINRLRENQSFFNRTFPTHRKGLLCGRTEEILHQEVLEVDFPMALDTNLF